MTRSPLDDGTLPAAAPRVTLNSDELIQIAVHESAFAGQDISCRLETAAANGWGRIGLLRRSLWQFGAERLGELLRERRLQVSSLSWTGGFTGSAGFTYREAIEDGRTAILEAQRIGADTLIVAPGGRGGHTFRHAQRVVADGLRHLGEIAGRHGVSLAVVTAPVQRRLTRWTCIDTLELAHQLLEIVDTPTVGLAVAVERWHGHPTALPALQSLALRIRIVTSGLHRASAAEPGLMQQNLSVSPTLQLLLDAGFCGTWELEAPNDEAAQDHQKEAAVWRCHAQQYRELARSLGRRGGVRLGRW